MRVAGVDTLEFGVDIEDYDKKVDRLLRTLERMKIDAQQKGCPLAMEVGGVTVEVQPSGARFYSYRLTSGDFVVCMASRQFGETPPIHVKLYSAFLWGLGGSEAQRRFMEWLRMFVGWSESGTRVSRVDIAVDTDEVDFAERDLDRVISRARMRQKECVVESVREGKRFTGFIIGRGNPLLCRIYDKGNEIRRSGKVWFEALWKERGWKGDRRVWRIEFQIRRGFLREIRGWEKASCDEVLSSLDRIWKYLVTEWLHISARARGKWEVVRGAFGEASGGAVVREAVRSGDLQRLLQQSAGLLVGIAAAASEVDAGKAGEIVASYAEEKARRVGRSFRELVKERRNRYGLA